MCRTFFFCVEVEVLSLQYYFCFFFSSKRNNVCMCTFYMRKVYFLSFFFLFVPQHIRSLLSISVRPYYAYMSRVESWKITLNKCMLFLITVNKHIYAFRMVIIKRMENLDVMWYDAYCYCMYMTIQIRKRKKICLQESKIWEYLQYLCRQKDKDSREWSILSFIIIIIYRAKVYINPTDE